MTTDAVSISHDDTIAVASRLRTTWRRIGQAENPASPIFREAVDQALSAAIELAELHVKADNKASVIANASGRLDQADHQIVSATQRELQLWIDRHKEAVASAKEGETSLEGLLARAQQHADDLRDMLAQAPPTNFSASARYNEIVGVAFETALQEIQSLKSQFVAAEMAKASDADSVNPYLLWVTTAALVAGLFHLYFSSGYVRDTVAKLTRGIWSMIAATLQ